MQSFLKHRYLVILLIVFIFFECLLYFGYRLDDTYIHLQYARRWLETGDYAFNPGTPRFSDTSPLWVFLISFGHRFFHLPFYFLCKFYGLAFGVLSIIVLYMTIRKISPEISPLPAAMGAGLFAIDFWFRKFAFSGMETPMAVFWVMFFFYFYIANSYFSIVAIGLLALTRPEGYFLLPLVLIDILLQTRGKKVIRIINTVLIFLIVVAPWWWYAIPVFGTVLPYSAALKAGGASFLKNIVRITMLLFSNVSPWVVWTLAGVIVLKNLRKQWIFISFPLLILTIYVFRVSNISARYMVILTPFIMIGGWMNMIDLCGRYKLSGKKFLTGTGVILAVLSVFFNFLIDVPYKNNYIDLLTRSEIAAGKWMNENTSRYARVASFDVGAVGYFSDRYIIDYWYLVTPEARYGIENTLSRYHPEFFLDKRKKGERDFECPAGAGCRIIFSHEHKGYRFTEKDPLTVTFYRLDWK